MATLSHEELIVKCTQVLESYDPKRTTVDAHLDDTPVLTNKMSDVDTKFVSQVFYGCIRYQKLLRLFVNSFLYKNPATAQRSDQSLYMILGYLLLFRVTELGMPEFRNFLFCGLGTPPALNALMQYCFSAEDLNNWVKQEWCKVYDITYIEQDIIGFLQSIKAEARPMLEEISLKATGTLGEDKDASDADATMIKSVKPPTQIRPFNLTQPKPRLIPQPDAISREIKAQPVPEIIKRTDLKKVEEEKTKRLEATRERTKAKYPKDLEFELKTAKRPGNDELAELEAAVHDLRYKECTFQPASAKPYRPPAAAAEVKQNAASVLREDHLVRRKQEKEFQLLKDYESDLRDASEFYEWQAERRKEDDIEDKMRVEQRKAEMEMARELAIEAQLSEIRKNHISADLQKEELKTALAAKEHEAQQELSRKVQLVQEVQEERILPRHAEEAALKARRENAEKERIRKAQEAEMKRQEEVLDMERKKDLIRQIRAIERVSVLKTAPFDPSEPPLKGLMEEMSLSELRERLKMLQAKHAAEVEQRRDRIIEKKEQKQHDLMSKAANLAKIRKTAHEEALVRKAETKARREEEERQRLLIREQCTVEAADKIRTKKKARADEEARLKRELREISIKRQFLAANAEMVEKKAHAEQQGGLEREANDRQKMVLLDQAKRNQIAQREHTIRVGNKAKEREDYKIMQQAVTERLEAARVDDAQLREEVRTAKKGAREFQNNLETRVTAKLGHSASKYSTHKGASSHGYSASAAH